MSTQKEKQKHLGTDLHEKSQGKKTFMLFLRTAMTPTSDETTVDLNTDARLLFDAIRKGKSHMIRFILDASPVDLANCTDLKGKTPLMVSCQIKEESRRSLAVRLLLANGANVNLQDDDERTVLSHACEMRCNDVVDTLVKHGSIDPDIPDNKGNTPLMYCSMVGNDVAMDILLRSFRRLGLAIDALNTEGFNALLIAAKYANIACAKLLVEGRAALHHRDNIKGLTAQEWLKKNGYSVDDITPLAMRLRSRAKLIKALNIARISIPNRLKQELNLTDDEDENANIKLAPSSAENPIANFYYNIQ
ncbi:hypothetical protein KUTeg_002898 [Tegillarca granosa]|uniref:Uncharacterized protein n=1 Tax=Tegillarca granosa TaxID=220873 RepID=A0ABQ9FQM3_TEGGR|nr:hypothetical protein KUTeg_002898 [Tegillarca granosa]